MSFLGCTSFDVGLSHFCGHCYDHVVVSFCWRFLILAVAFDEVGHKSSSLGYDLCVAGLVRNPFRVPYYGHLDLYRRIFVVFPWLNIQFFGHRLLTC